MAHRDVAATRVASGRSPLIDDELRAIGHTRPSRTIELSASPAATAA